LIGTGIRIHLLARQRRAGGVPAGGITNHSGEVANEESHLVAELLKLPHLVDEHRMTKMKVGSGRVEAGFDPQRLAS
jgi:hypothetical protein